MRAYLAVVKDSFREAFASRVLWILLALITLLLAALAPFSLAQEAAAQFERHEFQNGPAFLRELAGEGADAAPSPRQRIRQLLSEDLRRRLRELSPDDVPAQAAVLGSVRSELNDLLDRRDLYDAEAWKTTRLNDEAQELLKRGAANLSTDELRRFNRLLIDGAFRDHLVPASGKALYVEYFGYRIGPELPFRADQVAWLVKTALVALISFLAGVLGVFTAILVTASIIPQMFEPGAIDLLLSKPVSRSLLFLTRFAGACAFILLNTAYFIVGLWLIVGLRFDIWSGRLLLCIPVFLFLFMIYYSVSALAGVVWRNAVVSVIITVLFWAACFSVGTSKGVIETTFLNPTRLSVVLPAKDSLLAMNKGGQTFEWNDRAGTWEQVFQSGRDDIRRLVMPNNLIGPVYDPAGDRIIAVETTPTRFELFNGAGRLLVGAHDSQWNRIQGAATPNGVASLFITSEGELMVAGLSGVHRFEGDPAAEHVPFIVFGRDFGRSSKEGRFVEASSQPAQPWKRPFAADLAADGSRLAVYSEGQLTVMNRGADGRFELGPTRDLETKGPALAGCSRNTVLVALESGELRTFAADSLEPLGSFQPFGAQKPRAVAASTDGRWFAVVFHDRRLWLYDAEARDTADLPINRAGDISTAAFTPEGRLLLADRFTRVIEYQLEPFQVVRRYQPPADTLELVYRYAVTPIYTIFPKPGELDSLVSYLLTEEQSTPFNRRASANDLRAEQIVIDIWQPLWSNLAFVAVMLTLTCVYIARRDF